MILVRKISGGWTTTLMKYFRKKNKNTLMMIFLISQAFYRKHWSYHVHGTLHYSYWRLGTVKRKSNTEKLSFRKKTIEVSTGSSQILRSGWKSSLLEDFWGDHIYYYCNFHILQKVLRKWGHNRQEAQTCNFFCIKMTLKGFLKQEWEMVYLSIECCFRIPSRKGQIAHKWGSHITFPRTCWCWSHAFHTPKERSLSSV